VIQYDMGWRDNDGFHKIGALSKPPTELLSAVGILKSRAGGGRDISKMLEGIGGLEDSRGDTHQPI
jgi:hypothetical protein